MVVFPVLAPVTLAGWSVLLGSSARHASASEVAQDDFQSCADTHRVRFDSERPIKVTRLRYGDIPKADKSTRAAFVNDPVMNYLRDTPDAKTNPIKKKLGEWGNVVLLAVLMSHIALTVNHGDSVVVTSYALNSEEGKKSRRGRLVDQLYARFYNNVHKVLASPEQKKRQQELSTKMGTVFAEVIGDRSDDMMYVDAVATAPSRQGRGYAGALLDTACAIADEKDREMYLFSSNYANTFFYNSHGFEIVGKTALGSDNPTWTGSPIVITLMVRKPKLTSEKISK